MTSLKNEKPATSDLRPATKMVAAISLGCPKNLTDTEVMLGKLLEQGYTVSADTAHADVLLINTCAFVASARSEAYTTIEEYARKKKTKQQLVIAGCLPVYDREALLKRFPAVDLVIGPAEIYRLAELLAERRPGAHIASVNYTLGSANRLISTGPGFAYLKIAEGCDHRCAFCTIPRLRGPFRSKARELALAEAESLAQGGIRELVLVAQDTTRYGLDLDGTLQLPGLLKDLARIDGIEWIRIMYGHPIHITGELIEVIAQEKKVCKYLDLPLQHIDDDILKSMRRGLKEDETRRLVRTLQERIPGLALRTTFIVGYPGETEAQFEKLVEFVKEARFARVGVFTYSPEPGTAAAAGKMIKAEVAENRYDTLMQVQQDIAKEQQQMFVGKDMTVLMETGTHGRTYRDAPEIDGLVQVESPGLLPGTMVNVRITHASPYDLTGKVAG